MAVILKKIFPLLSHKGAHASGQTRQGNFFIIYILSRRGEVQLHGSI